MTRKRQEKAAVALAADDPRWQSITARRKSADGTFWYSVATTGIYCRPSCASRLPNPANVRFHPSKEDARAAGFRPCRRCRPDEPAIERGLAEVVAKACRAIERDEQTPTLNRLAVAAGMSVRSFHRIFKEATGLTPKAYASAHRATKARRGIERADRTITEAFYEAGFGSSGRFYEQSTALLGMSPSRYRAGGGGERLHFAIGETSLGAILVASSSKGVAAILLGSDPQRLLQQLQDRFPKALLVGADPAYEEVVARVIGLVEAPHLGHDLPLDIRGTAFQRRVWQALMKIPVGETVSYAELARRLAMPAAVRAVARACGANPLAIAIPCHRVVRTDGGLSGYAWGVDRKAGLLRRESIALAP